MGGEGRRGDRMRGSRGGGDGQMEGRRDAGWAEAERRDGGCYR